MCVVSCYHASLWKKCLYLLYIGTLWWYCHRAFSFLAEQSQVLQPSFMYQGMSSTLVVLMPSIGSSPVFPCPSWMWREQNWTQYSKYGREEWRNRMPWSAGNMLVDAAQVSCCCCKGALQTRLSFLDEFWQSLRDILDLGSRQVAGFQDSELGWQLSASVPCRRSPLHQHALLLPAGFDLLRWTSASNCVFQWNLFVLPVYCQDFM